MCNGKILHNQNKHTCTDLLFTFHGLQSRSNCYIKPLKCVLTIQLMSCTKGWWKWGEVAILRLCIVFTPQNRQQISPVYSVFKYVAVLKSPPSVCDWDTVLGEMAFRRLLKPALTLLDSTGGSITDFSTKTNLIKRSLAVDILTRIS